MKRRIITICLFIAICMLGCNKTDEGFDLSQQGEGASSAELPVLDEEIMVDDRVIEVKNDVSDYKVTIDDISFTDKRSEFETDYEDVVLVTYTYENFGEEVLLIDDLRFQLVDTEETVVYTPYYFAEGMFAEPIEKGESVTAQIAFGVSDGNTNFKLVYRDSVEEEGSLWVMETVLQK